MNIKPIQAARLSDQVVEQVLNMIKDGELKPGDKLPNETSLSKSFGVSRGILREAFIILETQGYIRRKQKGGTYISENVHQLLLTQGISNALRKSTYYELLEFRACLEEKVVEKAIERATSTQLDELRDLFECECTHENMYEMGYFFHYKLAEISRNVFYMDFIDTYYNLFFDLATESHKDKIRHIQVEQEHKEIMEAVCRRDKEAAIHAVRHHFEMAEKKVLERGE